MANERTEQYEFEPVIDEEVEKEAEERARHPTPEQFFLEEALKTLSETQLEIWAYHNYDKLNQVEIAEKMKMSQPGVFKALKAIEVKIKKYVKSNLATYKMIKKEMSL